MFTSSLCGSVSPRVSSGVDAASSVSNDDSTVSSHDGPCAVAVPVLCEEPISGEFCHSQPDCYSDAYVMAQKQHGSYSTVPAQSSPLFPKPAYVQLRFEKPNAEFDNQEDQDGEAPTGLTTRLCHSPSLEFTVSSLDTTVYDGDVSGSYNWETDSEGHMDIETQIEGTTSMYDQTHHPASRPSPHHRRHLQRSVSIDGDASSVEYAASPYASPTAEESDTITKDSYHLKHHANFYYIQRLPLVCASKRSMPLPHYQHVCPDNARQSAKELGTGSYLRSRRPNYHASAIPSTRPPDCGTGTLPPNWNQETSVMLGIGESNSSAPDINRSISINGRCSSYCRPKLLVPLSPRSRECGLLSGFGAEDSLELAEDLSTSGTRLIGLYDVVEPFGAYPYPWRSQLQQHAADTSITHHSTSCATMTGTRTAAFAE